MRRRLFHSPSRCSRDAAYERHHPAARATVTSTLRHHTLQSVTTSDLAAPLGSALEPMGGGERAAAAAGGVVSGEGDTMAVEAEAVEGTAVAVEGTAVAMEGTAAWITEGGGCGGGSSTTCSWLPATAADRRPDTAAVSVRGPSCPPAVGVCVCRSAVRAVPLLSVAVCVGPRSELSPCCRWLCVSVRGPSCPLLSVSVCVGPRSELSPAVGGCVCRSAVRAVPLLSVSVCVGPRSELSPCCRCLSVSVRGPGCPPAVGV